MFETNEYANLMPKDLLSGSSDAFPADSGLTSNAFSFNQPATNSLVQPAVVIYPGGSNNHLTVFGENDDGNNSTWDAVNPFWFAGGGGTNSLNNGIDGRDGSDDDLNPGNQYSARTDYLDNGHVNEWMTDSGGSFGGSAGTNSFSQPTYSDWK
jgi:hypothetical protein